MKTIKSYFVMRFSHARRGDRPPRVHLGVVMSRPKRRSKSRAARAAAARLDAPRTRRKQIKDWLARRLSDATGAARRARRRREGSIARARGRLESPAFDSEFRFSRPRRTRSTRRARARSDESDARGYARARASDAGRAARTGAVGVRRRGVRLRGGRGRGPHGKPRLRGATEQRWWGMVG